jgi:hypothetical protein
MGRGDTLALFRDALRYTLLLIVLVALAPLFIVLFIWFTLWELVDKKESDRFWKEVYDPYC